MPKTQQNLTVLAAVTATNSPPSGATAGVDLAQMRHPNEVAIGVYSSAGSGTMTVTLKAWGYHVAAVDNLARWYPLGTGATAGVLNEGTAIGEALANEIRHTELIRGLRGFDRLYIEVTAIGGTSTAVNALIAARDLGNRD